MIEQFGLKAVAAFFAVVALLAISTCSVQTARIDGLKVPVVGWTVMSSLKAKADDADKDHAAMAGKLSTCTDNTKKLQASIDAQNAMIDMQRKADADRLARANAELDRLRAGMTALQDQIAAIRKQPFDASTCPATILSIGQTIQKGMSP